MDAKFGKDVVVWMKDHPADVATVASVAAIVATGPVGLTLASIAIVASSFAAYEDVKDQKYLAAAFDLGAVVSGGAGIESRFAEASVEVAKKSSATQFATLSEQLLSVPTNDIKPLSEEQRAALAKLLKSVETRTQESSSIRSSGRERDIAAALSSVLGDPSFNPAAATEFHHR
jgi:hypothetical protein